MKRIPILDPEAVPVVGTDASLPPVPAERLTPAALRERLLTPPEWEPETRGDGGRFFHDRDPLAASVLVPLVPRPEGLAVLLTQRTAHLRDHAGQISFPGGRAESHDEGPVETALREAEEEIGLQRGQVEVVGTLPVYTTVTAFHVTPVVALVEPGFSLALDPFEVAEAFEVPLAFLMDPSHHRRHRFEQEGVVRQFLSMPYEAVDAQGAPRRWFIWGATAAMLRNLYRLLVV